MAPEPYTISISQEKIDTLKTKLSIAEFPDELSDAKWDLGTPLDDLQRLVKAWEKWDWRQAEERLNRTLPQFHTGINVDGFGELDIHFVWQKSEVANAIPLLFVHGCKSSNKSLGTVQRLIVAERAGAFPRGATYSPFASCSWRTSFSYCGPVPTKLRVQFWCQNTWFCSCAVRRDMSQTDAPAWI